MSRGSALTIAAIGFVALVGEQLLHECTHGVVTLLAGGRWAMLHLFAVERELPPDASLAWQIAVPASAATVNVVVGVASLLAARFGARGRLRLFATYFAAYNLLAGFGYLFFDALLYDPGADAAGDWKAVLSLLDAGLPARLAVGALGFAGYLAAFFWLPRAIRPFTVRGVEPTRAWRALLWIPYFAGNAALTALSPLHPLGAAGIFLVVTKDWMAFCAFFFAAFSLKDAEPPAAPEPLPTAPSTAWLVAGALTLAVAVALAAAPLRFG